MAVSNRQRKVRLSTRRIRTDAQAALATLNLSGVELTILLAGPRVMAGLNERFRGKQGTTDVLSFPMGEQDASCCGAEGEARYLGDIAIDPQRASEQAAEYGHSLDVELRRLVVHGILHLAGYDHEASRAEAARMRKMEERVIQSIPA